MNICALDRAIEHFGSQAKLAEALGVKPMAVSHWRNRGLPPERAIDIETASKGVVRRDELLPEFFIAPDRLPEKVA